MHAHLRKAWPIIPIHPCVGPNQNIDIRTDSKFTAPDPELAVVLGRKGKIVSRTLTNDVSA